MRAKIFLFIACIAGVILASIDLFEVKTPLMLQGSSVARVNDVDIPKDQYLNILKNMSEARGRPLSEKEAAFILEELIDEELMIQRGYELGLLQLNSVIRNNMKTALMESVIAENAQAEPDAKTLAEFYKNNSDYFTGSPRLRIAYTYFSEEKNAKEAVDFLKSGKTFETIKEKTAGKNIIDVPNALLNVKEMRKYLGPGLSEQIFIQSTNQEHFLIHYQERWHLIQVIEKQNGSTPEFSEIKSLVLNEYRRQQNEKAIENYLQSLRKRARIEQIDIKAINELNRQVN